jgi:hypothetical protein
MSMNEPVSTWELLKDLGFRPAPSTLSESGSGLVFDFGNLQLSAGRFLNTRLPIVYAPVKSQRRPGCENDGIFVVCLTSRLNVADVKAPIESVLMLLS